MNKLLIFMCMICLASCGDSSAKKTTPAPTPTASSSYSKGDRIMSIDISLASGQTYETAFTLVKSKGIDFVQLSLFWDELEPTPGSYDNTNLDIANYYYPLKSCKLAVNINCIDTTADRRPSDLKSLAWNHATVVQRYKNLIDHVVSRLSAVQLVSFSIGNEVDIFLGTNSTQWMQYTDFFNQTSAHCKTKVSVTTHVGVKTTFDASTTTKFSYVNTINAQSTALFITYYPMNADFTVKDPSVVATDFANIVSLYPGRKILFMEAGYQSGALCNSSEEKQRQFVANIFSAWDTYKDTITAVNFTWLHDKSSADVNTMAAYYGISESKFKEYLLTLGIRTSGGADKPAFAELCARAAERGW